jgi:hypothetical protein
MSMKQFEQLAGKFSGMVDLMESWDGWIHFKTLCYVAVGYASRTIFWLKSQKVRDAYPTVLHSIWKGGQ